MKRLIPWVSALVLAVSCQSGPTARIQAELEGFKDSAVVLQKLNFSRMVPVDTIRTDAAGRFRYKVKLSGSEPYFYYLYAGDRPLASMILLPSDDVRITVPADGTFSVEGSEESRLFQEVNTAYAEAAGQMEALSSALTEDSPEAEIREINRQINKLYVDYKRNAVKYVITHPRSITSAVVLFQQFGGGVPVFGQETDAVIFKTVQDSLASVYPKSEWLTALRDVVDARTRELQFNARLSDVSVISFPDIVMPDVNGQMRQLSDLEGQVIILSFWSAGQTEHKMFNIDLVELYEKYHAKGLEVYQVSLDIDKSAWAATVKSQGLPWISVNDGYGIQSPSVVSYNVNHIPSMFVMNRAGDIVAGDVFDKASLEQLIRRYL